MTARDLPPMPEAFVRAVYRAFDTDGSVEAMKAKWNTGLGSVWRSAASHGAAEAYENAAKVADVWTAKHIDDDMTEVRFTAENIAQDIRALAEKEAP